jgi:hypothetical protein
MKNNIEKIKFTIIEIERRQEAQKDKVYGELKKDR